MRHLVKHLWLNNRDEIVQNSLKDCHTQHLNSIVLVKQDNKCLVRLFVAHPGNNLWMNVKGASRTMSIAFHPHHCDITLQCVFGLLMNIRGLEDNYGTPMAKYRFASAIKGKGGTFEPMGDVAFRQIGAMNIEPGSSVYMPASHVHTVAVEAGTTCAWFVFEGKEDPAYEPYCWTNADPRPDPTLYQPITAQEIESDLKACGLL